MRLRKIPMTSPEEARARKNLSDSEVQRYLHNYFVGELEIRRSMLENCAKDALERVQGEVKILRQVLVKIHEADTNEVKSFYEND